MTRPLSVRLFADVVEEAGKVGPLSPDRAAIRLCALVDALGMAANSRGPVAADGGELHRLLVTIAATAFAAAQDLEAK